VTVKFKANSRPLTFTLWHFKITKEYRTFKKLQDKTYMHFDYLEDEECLKK